MVWIPLSYFLFYGFYQSLTYKKVLGEGIHAILFSLMNHYGLVQLTTAQWKFSGDKHKSLQVDTERTFHQRCPLVML